MTDIGKEYGTALFMLACEENAKTEYANALHNVEQAFAQNPGYMELLASPGIPLSERLSVIESAFAASIPENVISFLQLMCERGRMASFSETAKEYAALLEASEHIVSAKVTSAVELDKEQKQKLVDKLESVCGGKVNAEYFVDESLIGGLIIEADGKVMDGSLRHRLQDVKEVMNT